MEDISIVINGVFKMNDTSQFNPDTEMVIRPQQLDDVMFMTI